MLAESILEMWAYVLAQVCRISVIPKISFINPQKTLGCHGVTVGRSY